MIIRKLDDIISDVLTKSRHAPAEDVNPDYLINRVTDATVLVLKETMPDFVEGIKIKPLEYTPEGGKVGIKFRWVFEDEIVTHENHSSGTVTIRGVRGVDLSCVRAIHTKSVFEMPSRSGRQRYYGR